MLFLGDNLCDILLTYFWVPRQCLLLPASGLLPLPALVCPSFICGVPAPLEISSLCSWPPWILSVLMVTFSHKEQFLPIHYIGCARSSSGFGVVIELYGPQQVSLYTQPLFSLEKDAHCQGNGIRIHFQTITLFLDQEWSPGSLILSILFLNVVFFL